MVAGPWWEHPDDRRYDTITTSLILFQGRKHKEGKDEPRKLIADGRVDRWDIASAGEGFPDHIFHIHVNPFQVIRKDPKGNDELAWKDSILFLDHEDNGMMEVEQLSSK